VIGATLSIIDPIPIANIEAALAAIRAATESVASQPVLVLRLEPMQDAGAMQNVVNQRVDGDHAAHNLDPEDHLFGRAEQRLDRAMART
jgi:hypothetical protein